MPSPTVPNSRTFHVFDAPMCCSTGVCGPDSDAALARFAADLKWLEGLGFAIERYNLSREPEAFASNPAVAEAFRRRSIRALPLALLNSEPIAEGRYPTRGELAARLGFATGEETPGGLRIVVDPGCVPGPGCCG